MAEKNDPIYDEAENSESSENFSPDEWTIIGDNCSDKDDTDDGINSTDRINEDQENSGSMEELTTPNDNTTENERGIIIIEKHDEDSDGISVITESEAEHLVVNKKFREIDNCKSHVLGTLKVYEKSAERTAPQAATILNVVIACSLAAIVGLGVGRILGMDDKCPVTNAVDFSSIKMESDNLINQIKELSEVRDVLDEIKASIPQVKQAHGRISHKSKSKRSERREKAQKISDTYIFDPDTTVLEQLQTSLNTLCSVIDGMNPENDFIKSDTLRTQGVVADLIEFKKIILTVVKEFEDTDRPKELEFLRHAEKRIRDVCESLLGDLSYTIHGLTMKIHHKLNKVRHKLNRRLCLLKNSESIDGRVFEYLEENNSFLESCDKILNVTLKQSPQSVKNNKREETDKRIHSKRTSRSKKSSIKQFASESEDDNYLGDTSSESSMPDLTYDPHDHNFGEKREFLQQRGEKAKQKPGKVLSENDSKRRRTRNAKSTKSSRGRSSRKSITELLVPAQSCPLTKEHWLESQSGYPETQRLEVLILNEKPLYSTVLKSDINVAPSAGINNDKKNDLEQLKPENLYVHLDTEAIEETDQERKILLSKVEKAKENSKETMHNVTPSESGINVETLKNIKEEVNNNIREPVVKYNGVTKDQEASQSEKICDHKWEGSEKFKETGKGSLKKCRNGVACSFDEPAAQSGPHKRPARSTSDHDDDYKHKKRSTDKSVKEKSAKKREDDRKKSKKEKREGKHSSSSKFTDTKNEKGFKNRGDKQKFDEQLAGDWQLQRSQAREMHRDRDHRSEWFFDRANFRQDARKNVNEKRSGKFGAGRFSPYQPCKFDPKEKCESNFEEWIENEESEDYWQQAKDMNGQKHSSSRAGFTAKKINKMPHRKNIMQSKRH